MPNSPMSVTFCKYSNFEVHTKEYGCFFFFFACAISFYGFKKNLELSLRSFSRLKKYENVTDYTFSHLFVLVMVT